MQSSFPSQQMQEESKNQRNNVNRGIKLKLKKDYDSKPSPKERVEPKHVEEKDLIVKHGLYDYDLTDLDVDEH